MLLSIMLLGTFLRFAMVITAARFHPLPRPYITRRFAVPTAPLRD
jgi:hypothetical protein